MVTPLPPDVVNESAAAAAGDSRRPGLIALLVSWGDLMAFLGPEVNSLPPTVSGPAHIAIDASQSGNSACPMQLLHCGVEFWSDAAARPVDIRVTGTSSDEQAAPVFPTRKVGETHVCHAGPWSTLAESPATICRGTTNARLLGNSTTTALEAVCSSRNRLLQFVFHGLRRIGRIDFFGEWRRLERRVLGRDVALGGRIF